MKNFIAGKIVNQGYYLAFIPNTINRKWEIDDMDTLYLLSHADHLIGKMDTYSEYVDIELYLSMHIAKEATQSSRIEGTQTRFEETFMRKEDIEVERRDDWDELQNYIAATNYAVAELKNLPFSSRLMKQTHRMLLSGVRGEHRLPGEFRSSQNWIGGANINNASFVPPPHSDVPALISDLEKFANNREIPLPNLLKIALIHYQFETIHPFLDGNGRIGRLLIPLFLVDKNLLKHPILYLSDFFERNRNLYYDNLTMVRNQNNLNQWFKFFLTGVVEICEKGIATLEGVFKLQHSVNERINTLGVRAFDAGKVMKALYKNPVIDVSKMSEIIEKSNVSAYKMLADLEKIGILHKIMGDRWKRRYAFKEYLDLFY